jgi:predicted O-methyltransferase YrrM
VLNSLRNLFADEILYLRLWLSEESRKKAKYGLMFWNVVRQYPTWKRSLAKEYWEGPLKDEVPWITVEALEFLNGFIRPEFKVFEYGCGGSTIYFSKNVASVVSIENDPNWFSEMQHTLNAMSVKNVDLRLKEGVPSPEGVHYDPDDPDLYLSASANYKNYNFKEYVSTIDQFDDESFHVVFIDGRARPSCVRHAVKKVKSGGCLILDNSERPHYTNKTGEYVVGWKKNVFYGPIPYLRYFSETTVWVRR